MGIIGGCEAAPMTTIKQRLDDSLSGLSELSQRMDKLCTNCGFYDGDPIKQSEQIKQSCLDQTASDIAAMVNRLHALMDKLQKIA